MFGTSTELHLTHNHNAKWNHLAFDSNHNLIRKTVTIIWSYSFQFEINQKYDQSDVIPGIQTKNLLIRSSFKMKKPSQELSVLIIVPRA